MADKISQAAQLYEDFTGHTPDRVRMVNTRDDDTAIAIGPAEAIAYNTVRDGRRESYIHEFRKGSRPLLAAAHDGKRLYLLGGAYRFTDRGIEDRRMAQIALVNPSKRKGATMATRKKPRTAKQRAATAKLLAWNRAHRRRAGHPKTKSSRYVNPHKHHGHHGHHGGHHGRKHNPSRRRHSYRRHNPIDVLSGSFWQTEVAPVAVGAGAAIGADLLIGFLPLPAMLQSGMPRQLTRLAVVAGLGYGAGMAMKSKRLGAEVAAGGIAVVLYDMVKGMLVSMFPTLPLQPVATVVVPTTAPAATTSTTTAGWISPAVSLGYEGEADYNYDGMGAYVDGMGEVGAYVDGVEVRAY